jgi:hypothetical protein
MTESWTRGIESGLTRLKAIQIQFWSNQLFQGHKKGIKMVHFYNAKSMLFSRYLQIAQFSELQSTIMINPKTTKMFPDSFNQRLLVDGTGIYTDVCIVVKSSHQMQRWLQLKRIDKTMIKILHYTQST